MKIQMAIAIFLLIGAFFIIAQNNLNVSHTEDLGKFFPLYTVWIGHSLYNSWQTAGYAVKLEWLPNISAPQSQANATAVKINNSPNKSDSVYYG